MIGAEVIERLWQQCGGGAGGGGGGDGGVCGGGGGGGGKFKPSTPPHLHCAPPFHQHQ